MIYWFMKRARRGVLLLGLPVAVLAFVLLNTAFSTQSSELEETCLARGDSDGDNMNDAYELFYGLNPANPADVLFDYDGDALTNLAESVKLTDPFCEDTDRDGFFDAADEKISRAYIGWGDPQFTTGDNYEYAHPDWFLGAYKDGGEWMVASESNGVDFISGWHVSALESNDVSLNIDLNRSILTNNLRYAIHYLAGNNASLYVDLLDTNGVVVVENLYGNLISVSNAANYAVIPGLASAKRSGEAGEAGLPELGQGIQSTNSFLLLNIPTAKFPEAAVIQLRACHSRDMSGIALSGVEVFVHEGLLYIDEDNDGLDADQECQIGTSDYCVDSNNNGTNDYDECFGGGGDGGGGGGGGDDDGDDEEDDPHKKKNIIYVDQAIGSDTFTGRSPVPISQKIGTNKGPKKTVHAGLSIAETNDTIIIRSGTYNENLNIQGKDVKVFIEGNVRL